MKKWITLSLCLLLSGFLSGQSGNTEAKPVEGYEINGFFHHQTIHRRVFPDRLQRN